MLVNNFNNLKIVLGVFFHVGDVVDIHFGPANGNTGKIVRALKDGYYKVRLVDKSYRWVHRCDMSHHYNEKQG